MLRNNDRDRIMEAMVIAIPARKTSWPKLLKNQAEATKNASTHSDLSLRYSLFKFFPI